MEEGGAVATHCRALPAAAASRRGPRETRLTSSSRCGAQRCAGRGCEGGCTFVCTRHLATCRRCSWCRTCRASAARTGASSTTRAAPCGTSSSSDSASRARTRRAGGGARAPTAVLDEHAPSLLLRLQGAGVKISRPGHNATGGLVSNVTWADVAIQSPREQRPASGLLTAQGTHSQRALLAPHPLPRRLRGHLRERLQRRRADVRPAQG